jgi:undecaprenyl-diphosphatase
VILVIVRFLYYIYVSENRAFFWNFPVNPFTAVLLGLIQGVTEFLPISSTAHLTLFGKLTGLIDPLHPESWTEFVAVLQLGTLAAVFVFFWTDLFAIVKAFFADLRSWGGGKGIAGFSQDGRMALLIVLGSMPVGILGFLLKHLIEGALTKSVLVIAASMIGLAVLLWYAERAARHVRTMQDVTWRDALVIGFAQVMALVPGSSRSGTTMTAALFVGLTRETAARFSFLLSIPAVLGSGLYELTKVHDITALGVPNLIIATVVSGIAGYVSIAWLLKYLMNHSTLVFVGYRIGLGVLLLLLLLLNVIPG